MLAIVQNFRISPSDVLLILLVSALVIFPVLFWGPPVGTSDFTHHIQIANAYFDSIRNGVLIPDWVFAENHGYGAVTVRFYPPLLHYTLAIFKLIFGTWHIAFFAAFTFWSFVGGLGIFLWMREIDGTRRQALSAAFLFSLIPYHLNQLYNSSMLGEFVALSILPFGFYFAKRICTGGGIANMVGLGITFALLILSNLPQTVIGILCIGLYLLFHLSKENLFRTFSLLVLSGILGLVLSAFYWVRMAMEMSWIVVGHPLNDPAYDYNNHFLLNSLDLDAQGAWFASLMFIGSLVLVGVALIVSGKYQDVRGSPDLLSITFLIVFAGTMLLPVSKPLWDNITLLQRIQFPWRFLSVVSLASAMILARVLGTANVEGWRTRRPAFLVLAGIVLILATFSVKQVMLAATFLEPKEFNEMPERVAAKTGLEHFRPIWASDQTFSIRDRVLAGDREVSIRGREIIIAEGEPMRARIAALFYPHWKAFVNDEPVPVESDGGAISIDLSSANSEIKLIFEEPYYSLSSRYVSLAAWVAVLFFCSVYNLRSRVRIYE